MKRGGARTKDGRSVGRSGWNDGRVGEGRLLLRSWFGMFDRAMKAYGSA
jgi:hypothetical protein